MAKSQRLLTTKAFSEKAGVSPATVSSWLKKGKIKGNKEGRKWMIPESELKKAAGGKKAPAKAAKAMAKKPKATGDAKTYSVETFSAMTYLTAFGVKKWFKEGRLTGRVDASGKLCIDAANLAKPSVKRLLR